MNVSLPIPPDFTAAWERACEAVKDKRFNDAEQSFDAAARACPEVWIGLGSADIKDENYKSAIGKFERCFRHTSRDNVRAICVNNIGMCMERMGDRAGAFEKFKTAIAIDKRNIDAMVNMGHCLTWQNKPAEALQWFNRALTRNPGADEIKFSKSMALLLMGDLESGLPLYEHRTKEPFRTSIPEWRGQDLSGKHLLVVAEQGAGDTIQMARYLEYINIKAIKVSFVVQKGLGDLFSQWKWLSVYDEHEDVPPGFDYIARTMSLPRLMGGVFPSDKLKPTARFITHDPSTFKVGICWGGSPDHKHDIWRSTKLAQWHDLLSVPGVSFYSLQVGERSSEVEGTNVVDLSPRLKNYADTANAIAAMDLVISVDTSIVHLAGSLGKPVWMLTPFSADWRWGMDRTDSDWYPSLLLFRQKADREWLPVFWALRDALHKQASVRSRELNRGLVEHLPPRPCAVQKS